MSGIVLATHGGETAVHLARMASAPVLALPASRAAIPRNAVVAVDFSPTSVVAARTVARWLAAGDTLHIVHVGQGDEHALDRSPVPAADGESATTRLGRVVAMLGPMAGVCVETAELRGDPAPMLSVDHSPRRDPCVSTAS